MSGVHLFGLEGRNPLGFLAALGVQEAFANEGEQPKLWWSDDITPHAVTDEEFTVDRIAERGLQAFGELNESLVVNPRRTDGSKMPKGDELKLTPEDIRTYLRQARECGRFGRLAAALLAEGSRDNQGAAKPTDFYFTAGQQKFLEMARKILGAVTRDDVLEALEGPWSYRSKAPSLGWDIADDRVYALRANDPGPEKKLSNPGPEALALLGLSRHPVFAGRDRTLTSGCSGSWKAGYYSWPLWSRPASARAVESLLAHAYDHDHPAASGRRPWFPSWGVSLILRSPIRRSDQGGYGTFGPPEVAWRKAW